MRTFDFHFAETELSRLVEEAAAGDAFVIAKAGRPLVKVVPLDSPKAKRSIGFAEGEIALPEDFDAMDE